MTARRVQLSRSKGWRKPEDAVVVTRPSRWGNPFKIGPDRDAQTCVEQYRLWVLAQPDFVNAIRTELAGKNLACWCSATAPCHADVLLAIANQPSCVACEAGEHEACERRREIVGGERTLAVAIFGENVTGCCCG